MRKTIRLVVAAVAITGCGEEATQTPKATGAAKKIAKQHVEHFETDLDLAQAKRLFAGNEEGIDPAVLAGRWELQLNDTLGILEVRAPDGGGPVLDLVSDDGDAFTLAERSCEKPFVVRVQRSPQSLTLSRGRGRCDGTIDLLIEEPWRRMR